MDNTVTETSLTIPLENDYQDLRDSVARVCKEFPGEYWRKLDDE